MAAQPPGTPPIRAHRFATHRLRRVLLQTPELVVLLPSLVWINLVGWSLLAVTLCTMSSLWLFARYLLLWCAWQYFQHGRYYETTKFARAARRMAPSSCDAYWLLGISALQRNRPSLAVTYFQQACQRDPDNTKLRAALAASYVLAAEPESTTRYDHYANYVQQNTFEATMVLNNCASVDQQIEHYLRTAIPYTHRMSDRAVIYCALANHLLKMGRRAEAVTYLAQAIRWVPTCPPVMRGSLHYRLGELLWQCGQIEMAYEQFRASLNADPYGPYAARARQAIAHIPADQFKLLACPQLTVSGEKIEFVPERENVQSSL